MPTIGSVEAADMFSGLAFVEIDSLTAYTWHTNTYAHTHTHSRMHVHTYTNAHTFTPLCQCLSEETLKAVGPFYLARKSKRSHQSAREMCNLSWTSPLLEKDTSKNKHVYNTQVLVLRSIGRRGKKISNITTVAQGIFDIGMCDFYCP